MRGKGWKQRRRTNGDGIGDGTHEVDELLVLLHGALRDFEEHRRILLHLLEGIGARHDFVISLWRKKREERERRACASA